MNIGGYSYDIEDLNDDGEIDFSDGGDRYIAGQATPKVTIGSNISFRYKRFRPVFADQRSFGHKIYNGNFPDLYEHEYIPRLQRNEESSATEHQGSDRHRLLAGKGRLTSTSTM